MPATPNVLHYIKNENVTSLIHLCKTFKNQRLLREFIYLI